MATTEQVENMMATMQRMIAVMETNAATAAATAAAATTAATDDCRCR